MWNTNSGTWQVTEDLKFVSDPVLFGRHVVELNATDNTLVRSYVWGLDLSGTMDGAGGVGGLLWVTLHTASGSAAGTHFTAYDGNGNVVALVSATTGTETARYEYGPFGEAIRATGPAASLNPFRFSTKRTCNTTDLVLYEYRAYSPVLGRWLSRDPIEERAFRIVNWAVIPMDKHGYEEGALVTALYTYLGNMPFAVDLYGLAIVSTGVKRCKEPALLGHAWIEYPGGSCGYYPSGSIWGSPGQIVNPDSYYAGLPRKKCEEILLDSCAYDIARFVKCIKAVCRPRQYGWYHVISHNCWHWSANAIWDCILFARRP